MQYVVGVLCCLFGGCYIWSVVAVWCRCVQHVVCVSGVVYVSVLQCPTNHAPHAPHASYVLCVLCSACGMRMYCVRGLLLCGMYCVWNKG